MTTGDAEQAGTHPLAPEPHPDVAELRGVPLFRDLPEEALLWFAQRSTVTEHDGETILIRAGDPADHLMVVLEGGVSFSGEIGGQPVHYSVAAHEVTGALPQSRMTNFPSTGRAVGHTRLVRLHREHFADLRVSVPGLEPRLLAVMTRRIREAAQAEEQRDRMGALGRLAAGLAHELNNPAAAVRAGSGSLQERLASLPAVVAALLQAGVEASDVQRADDLARTAASRGEVRLGTLERGELEDRLADDLEDLGVPDAIDRAVTLVEGGLRPEDLGRLGPVGAQRLGALLGYLEFRLDCEALARDVANASGRISELVGAVKRYSHMDRGGDHQPTDVRDGLDSTVTMLGHKLRAHGIELHREYALDTPRTLANEGELNQVWTNLIDNAIDVLPQGGRIELRTGTLEGMLCVRVIDDGPGIAEDVQDRIFEPFFTTKAVGQGTGLGLDMVRRIVSRQHGGSVRLNSRPGRTEFLVLLPVLQDDDTRRLAAQEEQA